MANLFFRTCVAPYRIDTYNALHEKLGCEFYFLYKEDKSQKFDMQALYKKCSFQPHFLKTVSFIRSHYNICVDIWSILKKEKPQISIVPEYKILTVQVLLYKYLFNRRMKVVSMCDDSYDMVINDHDFSTVHKWARKLVVPFLDDLLLVDSRVADWYSKKYKKGIWLPIIRDEKKEIPDYQRVLQLSREYCDKFSLIGKKVLLFVGRLDPVKNLDLLLDAISKTQENFVTVIVGYGELEHILKEKASSINKPIVFAGRYEGDGVRAWYNIADLFVLPSKQEAFGAVTNEALIAGVPCLVSENAGSACLIDKNNGSVVNPYDPELLSQIIDKYFNKINAKNEIVSRHNLMPFTFEETIDRTISHLFSSRRKSI